MMTKIHYESSSLVSQEHTVNWIRQVSLNNF